MRAKEDRLSHAIEPGLTITQKRRERGGTQRGGTATKGARTSVRFTVQMGGVQLIRESSSGRTLKRNEFRAPKCSRHAEILTDSSAEFGRQIHAHLLVWFTCFSSAHLCALCASAFEQGFSFSTTWIGLSAHGFGAGGRSVFLVGVLSQEAHATDGMLARHDRCAGTAPPSQRAATRFAVRFSSKAGAKGASTLLGIPRRRALVIMCELIPKETGHEPETHPNQTRNKTAENLDAHDQFSSAADLLPA